jgi:hypothetical protein
MPSIAVSLPHSVTFHPSVRKVNKQCHRLQSVCPTRLHSTLPSEKLTNNAIDCSPHFLFDDFWERLRTTASNLKMFFFEMMFRILMHVYKTINLHEFHTGISYQNPYIEIRHLRSGWAGMDLLSRHFLLRPTSLTDSVCSPCLDFHTRISFSNHKYTYNE